MTKYTFLRKILVQSVVLFMILDVQKSKNLKCFVFGKPKFENESPTYEVYLVILV